VLEDGKHYRRSPNLYPTDESPWEFGKADWLELDRPQMKASDFQDTGRFELLKTFGRVHETTTITTRLNFAHYRDLRTNELYEVQELPAQYRKSPVPYTPGADPWFGDADWIRLGP
jgi:hypothetical protein